MTTTSTGSEVALTGGPLDVLRRRPLVSFFVIAYVVTWLLWLPVTVGGLPSFDPDTFAPNLWVLPAIAIGVTGTAWFMTWVTQGRAGLRRMVQRLLTWRVGPQWWLVAILLIPGTGIVIGALLGTPDALQAFLPAALVFYPAAYLAHFIFGPLFEESGWRGFALPRMQAYHGPLKGTLLLGLIWSAWHFGLYLPSWFAGGVVSGLMALGMFVLFTTSMTFIFTWLSNNTRASLLLCILLHGSVDGSITYLQRLAANGVISADAASMVIALGMLIGCIVWAIILVAATRGKLSYPRYQRELGDLDVSPTLTRVPTGQ